jgi:hypothetical protein
MSLFAARNNVEILTDWEQLRFFELKNTNDKQVDGIFQRELQKNKLYESQSSGLPTGTYFYILTCYLCGR